MEITRSDQFPVAFGLTTKLDMPDVKAAFPPGASPEVMALYYSAFDTEQWNALSGSEQLSVASAVVKRVEDAQPKQINPAVGPEVPKTP
jgi:hypothetical protein